MSKENFSKTLNLFDATTIVAGSMLGSGIFIVSADISRQVQSPLLLLIVWIIAGLLTVTGALCYGEYAASIPEAGGQYVYLKKIWGKIPAFLYGWTLFLVIQSGTIAAVAVAFAKFLGIIIPSVSSSIHIFNLMNFSISTQQLVAISLLILLTIINSKGIKTGAILQNIFTVTKLLALLGVVICGLGIGFNQDIIKQTLATTNTMPASGLNVLSILAVAMVGALFSSDAWNNVTFIAAEIKNAEKNLPLSLLFGTGVITLLYLLTNLAYLAVLPLDKIKFATEDIVGATLMEAIFGEIGKVIIAIIILISAFGCMNGMIIAGARVYYAMAKDGLFFKKLSHLGEKSHVPENSLIVQCIWACILVLSGNYSQLLDYVIFAALLFYIITVGGLFKYRKDFPDVQRPYKTLFYPYLPLIYCLIAGFIALNLLIYKPQYTWPGLLIVLSGIPVYLFWQRNSSTTLNIDEDIKSIN